MRADEIIESVWKSGRPGGRGSPAQSAHRSVQVGALVGSEAGSEVLGPGLRRAGAAGGGTGSETVSISNQHAGDVHCASSIGQAPRPE